MSDDSVLVHQSGYITRITINRPHARNSLNAGTIQGLIAAFTRVSQSNDIRVVVLSGSGTEAFCAGADITELTNDPSPEGRRRFFQSVSSLVESITRCPVPVIAEVHGFALAGGCGLVAAADIAIASDTAVFALPEVAIGLAPMVVMAPLIRAIGFKALSALALTGERIPAARALAIGLVSQVLPQDQVGSTIEEICKGICSKSPRAVSATKAALADLYETHSLTFMGELADRSALLSLTPEACEGLAAFCEKRAPRWRA